MKRRAKILSSVAAALFALQAEAQPPIVDTPPSQPPTVPPTDVEAIRPRPQPPTPTLTEPAEMPFFQPPEPSPSLLDPQSRFDYRGSPLGSYAPYITSSVFGAPSDPFDSARSFTTLDSARIQQRAPANTPELMQMLPGVLIQRTNLGGGSFILRGRNGNQNLILVDGIPINDAGWRFSNVQYLNYIDPGVIERIEVIRGPASVLFGSGALGGVLNIITKSHKDFDQTVSLGGGFITQYSSAIQSAYERIEVNGNFQNLGFWGGGSYLYTGAVYAGQGALFPNFATGYDQLAGDLRLDWQLGSGWTLTFVHQHLFQNDVPRTDRFPLATVNPTRFENRPTFGDQERDFTYARLSWLGEEGDPVSGLQITAATQRRLEREFELRVAERVPPNSAGPLVTQRTRLRDGFEEINGVLLDVRGWTNLGVGHTLSYGVYLSYEDADAGRVQIQSANVGGTLIGRPVTTITPTLPPDGLYRQFGVYLFDQLAVTDWWLLAGGVRFSSITAEGTARLFNTGAGALPPVPFNLSFEDWSAEFGTTVKITENLHWVASVSEGFRAPNLEDLGANERATAIGPDNGNVNLQPERALNYETGFKYRGERFAGAVTWFYTHYESLIVREFPPGSTAASRANHRGLSHGLEIEGVWQVTDNLSVFLVGTHIYAQDLTSDEPLRVPPAFMTIGSRWTAPGAYSRFFVEVFADLMARQDRLGRFDYLDIRIPDGGTSAWQTLNLRAGYDAGRGGQLVLGLFNIFDQNYRFHGSGVDAPGREFRLGYSVRF